MPQHVQILFYKVLYCSSKHFLYNHVLLCDLFDELYSFKFFWMNVSPCDKKKSSFCVYWGTGGSSVTGTSSSGFLLCSANRWDLLGKRFWFNKRESGMIFFKSWQKLTCYHPYCHWAKISKSGKWRKSIFCDNFFKIGQKLIL